MGTGLITEDSVRRQITSTVQKVSILCNLVEDFKSVFHLAKEGKNSNFLKILGAHGVRANALGNAFA